MFRKLLISIAMLLAAVPTFAQIPPPERVHPADSGISAELRGPTQTMYGYDPGLEIGLSVLETDFDKFETVGGGTVGMMLADAHFDILALEKRMIEGMEGGVFNLASRDATVAGVRGRISEWSSENDVGDEIRNRLAIARQGDRVIYGFYLWFENGGSEVEAFTRSLRFEPVADPGALRAKVMLMNAIGTYWFGTETAARAGFSPALGEIADAKRVRETELVTGYGEPVMVEAARLAKDGWRTFRVHHEKAVVDWSIAGTDTQITGLTWQLINRK